MFGFQKGIPAVLSKGYSCLDSTSTGRWEGTRWPAFWIEEGIWKCSPDAWDMDPSPTQPLRAMPYRAVLAQHSSYRRLSCTRQQGERQELRPSDQCGEINIQYTQLCCYLTHAFSWSLPNSELCRLHYIPVECEKHGFGVRQTWECTWLRPVGPQDRLFKLSESQLFCKLGQLKDKPNNPVRCLTTVSHT